VGSATTDKDSDIAVSHGHRNLVWTYVKNMPGPLFWLYLPQHLLIIVVTHILVWETGTLAGRPQGQIGSDQRPSRDVADTQENTCAMLGNPRVIQEMMIRGLPRVGRNE